MQKTTQFRVCLAALGLCMLVLFIQYQILKVRVAFAEDQISIAYEARQKALEASTPTEAARFLKYVIYYYPSGTKQARTSRLNRMVELVRSNVVSDIIADLKNKTGRDYGNEPTQWLQHYPSRSP